MTLEDLKLDTVYKTPNGLIFFTNYSNPETKKSVFDGFAISVIYTNRLINYSPSNINSYSDDLSDIKSYYLHNFITAVFNWSPR